MVYKMVGADQSGKFPPRVETAISAKIAIEVSTDGKEAKEALDGIFAPISGSANYAPASGSANYAPAAGSTKYASLGSDGKVVASQMPSSTATLRTAFVNFPPVWEKATSTATAVACRGIFFVATQSGTATKVRARVNTTTGLTYTVGIYEVSAADRATVTAVTGQATFTETAGATNKTLSLTLSAALVAGKYYVLAITSSNGSVDIYYRNEGCAFHSAVSSTVWEGAVDPQRSFTGVPAVNSVFSKGSDYVCVGMSVDY